MSAAGDTDQCETNADSMMGQERGMMAWAGHKMKPNYKTLYVVHINVIMGKSKTHYHRHAYTNSCLGYNQIKLIKWNAKKTLWTRTSAMKEVSQRWCIQKIDMRESIDRLLIMVRLRLFSVNKSRKIDREEVEKSTRKEVNWCV